MPENMEKIVLSGDEVLPKACKVTYISRQGISKIFATKRCMNIDMSEFEQMIILAIL